MPLARLAVQEELHRRDNISGCDSSFFISVGNEPNRHACMYILATAARMECPPGISHYKERNEKTK